MATNTNPEDNVITTDSLKRTIHDTIFNRPSSPSEYTPEVMKIVNKYLEKTDMKENSSAKGELIDMDVTSEQGPFLLKVHHFELMRDVGKNRKYSQLLDPNRKYFNEDMWIRCHTMPKNTVWYKRKKVDDKKNKAVPLNVLAFDYKEYPVVFGTRQLMPAKKMNAEEIKNVFGPDPVFKEMVDLIEDKEIGRLKKWAQEMAFLNVNVDEKQEKCRNMFLTAHNIFKMSRSEKSGIFLSIVEMVKADMAKGYAFEKIEEYWDTMSREIDTIGIEMERRRKLGLPNFSDEYRALYHFKKHGIECGTDLHGYLNLFEDVVGNGIVMTITNVHFGGSRMICTEYGHRKFFCSTSTNESGEETIKTIMHQPQAVVDHFHKYPILFEGEYPFTIERTEAKTSKKKVDILYGTFLQKS